MKILWLIPIILTLDQASKLAVQQYLPRSVPVNLLANSDILRLTYIHNPGAAFGLNIGHPLLHTLIAIGALALLIYLFWTLPRDENLLRTALVLVMGGAIGNIIDRVYLGEVIDFFDVGFSDFRWPIFNVADSFITIGVGLMALGYSRQKHHHRT